MKLVKREGELKEEIKKRMLGNDVKHVTTDVMDLYCNKLERILYPKKKIEAFVPYDIREKIKEVREVVTLQVRMKEV